jgi:hypothetical protein
MRTRLVSLLVVLVALLAVGTAVAQSAVPYYVVPGKPGDRSDKTLTDISSLTLGTPSRWTEILELNKNRIQPDGRKLTDPKNLSAGWVLVLPKDASSGEIQIGQPPAPPATGPDLVLILSIAGAVVLLLAAGGVVVLLVRRRPVRNAEPIPAAGRQQQILETALRNVVAADIPAPPIYAATVDSDRVVLRLAPPLPNAVPPWQAREEGSSWQAPIWQLDKSVPDAATPFPLFIDLGVTDGDWTAVNLGRAPGLVAIDGKQADVETALARVTARGLRITCIGRPLRIAGAETVASVRDLLGDGPLPNPNVTGMLAVWGAPGGLPAELDHHLVLVTGDVPPPELDVLSELAARSGNSVAVLVLGDAPAAVWRLTVGPSGVLDGSSLGLATSPS